MNWDAVEALGAIAILITLILLIVQLRANSAMIKNSTAQNVSFAVAEWARQLTENPELYKIFRTGLLDDSKLSSEERGRFDLVMFQVFNGVSSVYDQYVNGGLDHDRWESELRTISANCNTPGGRASWERQKFMLRPSFRNEVEAYFENSQNDA